MRRRRGSKYRRRMRVRSMRGMVSIPKRFRGRRR